MEYVELVLDGSEVIVVVLCTEHAEYFPEDDGEHCISAPYTGEATCELCDFIKHFPINHQSETAGQTVQPGDAQAEAVEQGTEGTDGRGREQRSCAA